MDPSHKISKFVTNGTVGLLTVVFTLPALSTGAVAQEAGDLNSSQGLEEIVVTSRRRAENLQDVPISVQVFSSADVEAKSLTTLKELSQFTPNFSMYNSGIDGALTNDVVMRGIGNSLGGPSVGIYLDGVYLSTQQAIDLGMLDIDRVEVLFGPQGTLFGRNTIGGAVNYVSKRPTGEFSGNAQVDFGSYDRHDARVTLNGPLLPGTLNARLTLGTENRDGYMRILDFNSLRQIDELGNRDRLGARLLLDWIVSDDVTVLFSVERTDLDEKTTPRTAAGTINQTPAMRLHNTALNWSPPLLGRNMLPPDLYSTFGTYRDGEDNFNYLEATGGSITVDWRLGSDLSFKSITSYREYITGFGSDFDFSPHPVNYGQNFTDQEQWSQEFQLTGKSFADRLDWITGLYYFDETADDPSVSLSNTLVIERGLAPDTRRWIERLSTDTSWAVFGEGTFDITDKLSATLGVRYTEDEKTEWSARTDIFQRGFTCISCSLPFSGEMTVSDTSGRANLSYNWSEDLMTYVSVARGFKSGGLSASVLNPRDTVATLLAYLPERVVSYELGLKSTLLDNRLRLNATAFFNDYTNIQYQFFFSTLEDGVNRIVSVVSNAGAAEIRGFELQALFQPVESLTFTASAGHTDAEYTRSDVRGGPLTLDSEFVQTPKWSYTLSAQYQVPVGWGDLSARLDYSWKDQVYFDVTNRINPDLQQEALGLLNARISLGLSDGWRVEVYGTNLADEEHIVGALSLNGFGLPALVQPGAPREWGVMARYSF